MTRPQQSQSAVIEPPSDVSASARRFDHDFSRIPAHATASEGAAPSLGSALKAAGANGRAGVRDGVDLPVSPLALTDLGGDAGVPTPAPAPGASPPAPPAPAPGPAAPGPAAPVTAVSFGTVNSTTTPAALSPRIPPRIDQTVAVTLTGSGSVDISLDGSSAINGTATIDGAASKTLSASGAVKVRGTGQTTPGNAGNLRLVAKLGAATLGTSNAFTICAIPTTVTISLANLITGSERGIAVTTNNDSDSGQVSDLDQVQMSELVQYVNGIGCFAGITSGSNSGYLPASNTPHGVDSHGTPVALLTSVGSIDSNQVFVFKDARSGANGVSVINSGFNIHRDVTTAGAGALSITTSKAGVATTARGSSASAGRGSATGTQAV